MSSAARNTTNVRLPLQIVRSSFRVPGVSEKYCAVSPARLASLSNSTIMTQDSSSLSEHWCLYVCITWFLIRSHTASSCAWSRFVSSSRTYTSNCRCNLASADDSCDSFAAFMCCFTLLMLYNRCPPALTIVCTSFDFAQLRSTLWLTPTRSESSPGLHHSRRWGGGHSSESDEAESSVARFALSGCSWASAPGSFSASACEMTAAESESWISRLLRLHFLFSCCRATDCMILSYCFLASASSPTQSSKHSCHRLRSNVTKTSVSPGRLFVVISLYSQLFRWRDAMMMNLFRTCEALLTMRNLCRQPKK